MALSSLKLFAVYVLRSLKKKRKKNFFNNFGRVNTFFRHNYYILYFKYLKLVFYRVPSVFIRRVQKLIKFVCIGRVWLNVRVIFLTTRTMTRMREFFIIYTRVFSGMRATQRAETVANYVMIYRSISWYPDHRAAITNAIVVTAVRSSSF